MQRHWLTSTTALALVLNAAAPLPSSAYQMPAPANPAPRVAADLRLAENDANTAQGIVDGVVEGLGTTGSIEQGGSSVARESLENAQPGIETEAEAAAKAAADAEALATEQAQAEAQAAEQAQADAQAEAQAAEEAQAAAEAEAQAAAEAEAEAAANVEAQAEAEANAAADAEAAAQEQAEAEAEAARQAAEADAEAATQAAEAEAKAAQEKADAEAAAAQAAENAEAEAAIQTEQDAQPEAAAPEQAEVVPAQSGENSTPNIAAPERTESTENSAPDVLPEVSAADQASAAEAADKTSAAAAAASDEGEVVGTEDVTVTEEDARASNEEFATSASGQPAPVQAPVASSDDDSNDLLKNLGIAAAAGLGAYAIGRMLDGGGRVVSNTGDRVVVQEPSGGYRIIKDDDTLLRRPGNDVQTQTYSDGSTRSAVTEVDGSQTITIRAADGRVLRRTRILPDGREFVLFDDTKTYERVDVSELERAQQGRAFQDYDYSTQDVDQLRTALNAANGVLPDRTYSLNQIRRIDAVRHLVPVIALDAINFKTGSAVIDAAEAQDLSDLGNAMVAAINDDPRQVFLIEGHTDTVGDASYNLALSDRRAESVALALTEYFDVPPSNMIVQGYGESDLRIRQQGDIRANRRGAVRNITPLLDGGR